MVKETLSGGKMSTFGYDAQSRLTQITLPDESSIQYAYNAADLVRVNRGGSKHTYVYNLAGDIIKEYCFNGGLIESAYDINRRLIQKKAPSF